MSATIFILWDNRDYYGPDFVAVFSSREKALTHLHGGGYGASENGKRPWSKKELDATYTTDEPMWWSISEEEIQ